MKHHTKYNIEEQYQEVHMYKPLNHYSYPWCSRKED